ncbi:histidine--tRNA ligase [Hyperthermus butylicus]|uniref:Histidine--tRNA ligase n=1 Tax=Hyperthermus butylicus (strain DSM 5456 / JCM 9403 / PLM1-5) TaxID=415426 RepID=A2BLE1_HYPBU|nr:histidine--tRNA ligase [Hyperthermus butylicus]ABM80802.1 Histidyl-tRNA synthetase [Hyperthermus butylicus DSM 5456]
MPARIPLEPLRGFRDILEPDSKALTLLAQKFAKLAELHGYEEVIPPTLERFELFALKSGEEIRRTMYVFRDKAGREVALRPEATASIARIYLKHLRARPKPIKLYYIVNCFRYEEPQRARYREFWQAGVEYLGAEGVEGDFDPIKLLVAFYNSIGMLDDISLKLGTTKLYRILFGKYGVDEELQDHILHLMDKKMYNEALALVEEKVGRDLASLLEELWRNPADLENAREAVGDPEAARAVEELQTIASLIKTYNTRIEVRVNLSFARGLAYYTGIIYEVETKAIPVSIAGGGRYDNLIELYGGEHVPGTGFAIGLDRTLAALKELSKLDKLLAKPVRAAIVALSTEVLPYAAEIQDELVRMNIASTMLVEQKLHKALAWIARQGYRYAVIIGKKEQEEQTLTIRDLEKHLQKTIEYSMLKELEALDNIF